MHFYKLYELFCHGTEPSTQLHLIGVAMKVYNQTKPFRFRVFSLFAFCTLAIDPTLATAQHNSTPNALLALDSSAVDIPFSTAVGSLRAGKLCLPHGKMRVRDFVSGQSAFGLMLSQAVAELNSERQTQLSILSPLVSVHLVGISAKLCAKNWGVFGLGDRSSLAGDAAFTFEFSINRNGERAIAQHQVALKLKANDAQPPAEILNNALSELLTKIADGVIKL